MICRRYHLYLQGITKNLQGITKNLTVAAILVITVFVLIGVSSLVGSSSKASEDKRYKYYTSVEIRNGDTLWDIASEHMTGEYRNLHEYVGEIKALNGLQSDSIRSGQSLVIPYYSAELK